MYGKNKWKTRTWTRGNVTGWETVYGEYGETHHPATKDAINFRSFPKNNLNKRKVKKNGNEPWVESRVAQMVRACGC